VLGAGRFLAPQRNAAAYPNCPLGNGDINAFVALLSQQPPPVCP
jgi:hypothetical protein